MQEHEQFSSFLYLSFYIEYPKYDSILLYFSLGNII